MDSPNSKVWCINWPNGQIQAIDQERGSLSQNIIAGGYVNVDAILFDSQCKQIFYAADYTIYIVGDLGTVDAIYKTDDRISSLAIIDDILYYSASSDMPSSGYIASIDLRSLDCTIVRSYLNCPRNLVADKSRNHLYYVDVRGGKNVIIWLNLEHRNDDIVTTFDKIIDLRLHGGKLYAVCPDTIQCIDGDKTSTWYTGIGLRSLEFTDNDIYIASSVNGDHMITKLNQALNVVYSNVIGHDMKGGEPTSAISNMISDKTEKSIPSAGYLVFIDDSRHKIGVIEIGSNKPVRWQLSNDSLDNISGITIGVPINVENYMTSYVYLCNGESFTSPPANSISFVFIGGESSYPLANTDLHNPRNIAVDEHEGLIFYTTDCEVALLHLDGGAVQHQEKLIDKGLGYTNITTCVWDALEKRLWWCATRKGFRCIFATNAKGKTEKTSGWPIDNPAAPRIISIESTSRTIYWVGNDGEIYLSPYNSGQGTLIRRPKLTPQYLVNDGNHLYWSTYDGITMLSLSDWNSRYLYSGQTSGIAVG